MSFCSQVIRWFTVLLMFAPLTDSARNGKMGRIILKGGRSQIKTIITILIEV